MRSRLFGVTVGLLLGAGVSVLAQSWTTPRTWTAGELVTPSIMNSAVRDNLIVLRAGGFAVSSQAIGDLLCASSTTQFGRLADVATGQVLISGGVGACPSYSSTPTFTATNVTGLPVSTGISGLGTGVATALAVNVGSAGAFVTFNGALGTPSSGTLTNATGLPIAAGLSGLGAANRIPYATSATALATSSNFTYNGSAVEIAAAADGATSLVISNRGALAMTSNTNSSQFLSITNSATGTATSVAALLTAGSSAGRYQVFSQGYTPSGDILASGTLLRAEGAGGLSLSATNASGDVRIYSRNALAVTFGASQEATFAGAVTSSGTITSTGPSFVGTGVNPLLRLNQTGANASDWYIQVTNDANKYLQLYNATTGGLMNLSPAGLLTVSGTSVTVGTAGTTLGSLILSGNTSGTVTISPAAAAGTWTLTLPPDDGDAGEQLQTNGSGVTTWEAAASSREVKNLLGVLDPSEALARIVAVPIHRFRYKPDARGVGGDYSTEFTGIVADEAPWAMMHGGRIFSPISAAGHAFAAIQALEQRNQALERRIAQLEAR